MMPKNYQEHVYSGSQCQSGRHRQASDVVSRIQRSQVPYTERDAVPRYSPHGSLHEDLASYENAQRSSRHTSDHPCDIQYTLESRSIRGNSQVTAGQSLDMDIPTFDDADILPSRRTYNKEYIGEIRKIAERLLWQWLPVRFEGARFNIFAYFGVREHVNTDSQSSSHGTGSRLNTTNYQPGWQPGPRQRLSKRAANDSDEEGGDEYSGSRTLQRAELNIDRKYWACPYWKHDPRRYSLRKNCKCATYLLDSIPRLKQHLYRKHSPPRFFCTRCFDEFETQDLLLNHSGQEEPCRPQANKFTDSITPLQYDALKKKTPRECWENIYQILFPGDPLPDSPYIEEATQMHIELEDLRQYVIKEAPELIEHIDSGLYRRLGIRSNDLRETIQDIIESTVDQYINIVARKARVKRRDTSLSHENIVAWMPADWQILCPRRPQSLQLPAPTNYVCRSCHRQTCAQVTIVG